MICGAPRFAGHEIRRRKRGLKAKTKSRIIKLITIKL